MNFDHSSKDKDFRCDATWSVVARSDGYCSAAACPFVVVSRLSLSAGSQCLGRAMPLLRTRCHADPTKAGKFERRPTQIETEHAAEQIQLDPFDPT
jgi:hypothetical protein